MSLESLFTPRSVAVVGSMSPGKLGSVLLKQIIDGGFEGGLFTVNPKAQGAFSVPGYASITAIQKPVDLAIIASPAPSVKEVLEDSGQAGIRAAVVITAGFSEIGNKLGEQELLEVARKYGIRIIGPNCAGIINTHHRLFPTLQVRPPQGGVAVISQSGALGGLITAWADQLKLGISKFISYGNGVDLGQTELLQYLSQDDDTKVVAVYIESIPDGRKFLDALSSCASCKPVIVIKAGKTEVGKRATASHTGSMAGSDLVYEAAIRSSGAIRVETVEEMLDICLAFTTVNPPQGKKIAIVTNSGGPAVLAADYAEKLGLQVSEPSEGLKNKLREFLSPNCSLKNPIDMTVEGTEEGYRKSLIAVQTEYDAVIAMNVCPPYLNPIGIAHGVLDGSKDGEKPVLVTFQPPQVVAQSVEFLHAHRMENFPNGERAVAAIAALQHYAEGKKRLKSKTTLVPDRSRSSAVDLFGGRIHMLEPDAMTWLKQEGLPAPPFGRANSIDEAAIISKKIGFPVVMKVVSADILHKSDLGGVILDIDSEQKAQNAFQKISKAAMGKDFQGVVIYPMVKNARELIIGLSRDPQFGPVVTFGIGGIFTEILRDFSLRIAPVSNDEAQEMIKEIRGYRLLTGQRGEKPYDLSALADLLVKFSQLPFCFPEVGEIDLNPVFLFHEGLVIGDARIIRAG